MTVIDHPNLEPVLFTNGREGYRLEAPWRYTWTVGDVERRLEFPPGFLSDGASVPRILWSLTGITPDGLIRAAAFVHDCLYRFRGRLPPGWLFERPVGAEGSIAVADVRYTRQSSDAMFGRIMRQAGVAPRKRRLAYHGVRLCGWAVWMREAEVLAVDRAGMDAA